MNKSWPHFLKIGGLFFVFALAFGLSHLIQENSFISGLLNRYGYRAVFILGIIGGLNLVVPVPTVTFMPLFLEAGLNFWIIILLITIGMLLADGFAFLLGKTGRQIIVLNQEKNKILRRLEELKNKNKKLPYVFLFLFASLAPFPNEVIVIPMGFLGYKMRNLLFPLISGNIIFNVLYALGVVNIFNFIW